MNKNIACRAPLSIVWRRPRKARGDTKIQRWCRRTRRYITLCAILACPCSWTRRPPHRKRSVLLEPPPLEVCPLVILRYASAFFSVASTAAPRVCDRDKLPSRPTPTIEVRRKMREAAAHARTAAVSSSCGLPVDLTTHIGSFVALPCQSRIKVYSKWSLEGGFDCRISTQVLERLRDDHCETVSKF